jgi:hypothetical protein
MRMVLAFYSNRFYSEFPQLPLDIISYCLNLGSAFAGTYNKIICDNRKLFKLKYYRIFRLFVECCFCCLYTSGLAVYFIWPPLL